MAKTVLVGLLTLNTLIVSACGSSENATTRVNGAGSTFAYPLYSKWADAFGKVDANVQIDYQPIGSSAGVNLITSGRMDFGGTDGAGSTFAYPIASFTWALVPTKISDAAKRRSLVAFLNWGLTDGQAFAEELAYARLPDTLIEKVKPLVAQIQ